MNLLISLICIFYIAGRVQAKHHSKKGLVATFGNFSAVPLTLDEAEFQGWVRDGDDCHNGGHFNGHRLYQPSNVALALLYCENGQICGYQAIFPRDIFVQSESIYRHDLQPMVQPTEIDGEAYWQLTLYLDHPQGICDPDTPLRDLEREGVDKDVYYQNGPSPHDKYLLAVPRDRKDAADMGWDNQNCFPQMGWHNLFHARDFTDTSCSSWQPTLILYDAHGQRLGCGFWIYARSQETSYRFEKPPPAVVQIIMGESAPPCILEDKTTSLHMYYVQNPQAITCEE